MCLSLQAADSTTKQETASEPAIHQSACDDIVRTIHVPVGQVRFFVFEIHLDCRLPFILQNQSRYRLKFKGQYCRRFLAWI